MLFCEWLICFHLINKKGGSFLWCQQFLAILCVCADKPAPSAPRRRAYTTNISTVQNKQFSNQLQQNTVYHGSPVQSTLHVFLALQEFWFLENLGYAKIALGTINLRRRQNFQDFSPTISSFLPLSVGKLGKFLNPPPIFSKKFWHHKKFRYHMFISPIP